VSQIIHFVQDDAKKVPKAIKGTSSSVTPPALPHSTCTRSISRCVQAR